MLKDYENIAAGLFLCIGSELSGQQKSPVAENGESVYLDPESAFFFQNRVDESFLLPNSIMM